MEVLDAPDGYIQGNFYASLINRQQCMTQLNPHGSLWNWNRSKIQKFILLSPVLCFCTARPPRPPVRLTVSAEALLAWQDDDIVQASLLKCRINTSGRRRSWRRCSNLVLDHTELRGVRQVFPFQCCLSDDLRRKSQFGTTVSWTPRQSFRLSLFNRG